MDSPNQKATKFLKLRYLDPSQAQPEVKINEAWDILDEAIENGLPINTDTGSDSGGGPGSITVIGTDSPFEEILDVTTIRFEAIVESHTGGIAHVKGLKGADGAAGANGATGATGATGASGGQPPGAYWLTIGGGVVVLPVNAVKKVINAAGAIKRVLVLTDGGPGSLRIKVWKANVSSHTPPVVTDDITGGNDVVITSASSLDDSTLAGWTKTLLEGDVILFTLSNTSNFTSVSISLILQ